MCHRLSDKVCEASRQTQTKHFQTRVVRIRPSALWLPRNVGLMNDEIKSFDEYNLFRRGKQRWREPNFVMPINQKTKCGLCKRNFFSSEYIFLICKDCVKSKIEINNNANFSDVVYGLYSMTDELLYIGVTKNPIYRAHNHMLTKNFKVLKVIKYFDNRQDADDYEKWSIYNIKPILNRKFDNDWIKEPSDWNSVIFGAIAQPAKKKKKVSSGRSNNAKREKVRPINCARCNSTVGRKRKIVDGEVYHNRECSPRVKKTIEENNAQQEKKKQAREEKKKQKRRLNECFFCQRQTQARGRTLLKDSKGLKAFVHNTCLDKYEKSR